MKKHPLLILTILLIAAGATLIWLAAGGMPALAPEPTIEPLSRAELERALLAVEDLPEGWQQDEVAQEDEDAGETALFLGQELPDRSQQTVRARFSGGDLGPFLLYSVATYPAGEAALAFAEQAEVIGAAQPYTVTLAGGDEMVMDMWPLTFAELGSDSVAVRSVSSEAPLFGTVYSDSVYVLVEEGEAILRLTGIALGGEAMNREQMEALARRGVERMEAVIGGR